MKQIEGKIAIITGAGGGIGQSTALIMAQAGAGLPLGSESFDFLNLVFPAQTLQR